MSFDLYAQSILYHVLKHDVVLRTNQFIDVRCKKWGNFTIFSKSTVIFTTINPWCKFLNMSMWRFQEMTVNTATWLNHRKQFFKCFKIILPYYIKHASCIQGCFKKAGIKFKHSALCNEDEEYSTIKTFHLTSEHKVKSHPCLSNEWLHRHTIIIMYHCFHYKFESNHTK